MSESLWSKKTIAVISIAALAGALSPISANAWDNSSGPDEIVTVTVDIGENPDDGGPDGCTGFGSLTIPLTNILVVKERKTLKASWSGDEIDDDNNPDTPAGSDQFQDSNGGFMADERDLLRYPINPMVENTRTDYVSEAFTISFDADNCVVSERLGQVLTERQPVERYSTGIYQPGSYWQPVEMTWSDGVLGADDLRASANLMVDYTVLGVNRVDVGLYGDIPWDLTPVEGWNLENWGSTSPNIGLPIIWGSGGEANAKASITIFGDVPFGKYRVKHGFTLDTGTYNSVPWECFLGLCQP